MRALILSLLVILCWSPALGHCQTLIAPIGSSTTTDATESKEENKKDEDKEKDKKDKRRPGEIVVSTAVEGLNNPFSIAVDGDANRIFVAESGAQRIVEIKNGKAVEIAGEFPASTFRGYQAGPLSLFAAGENVLLVGHDDEKGVGSITKLTEASDAKDEPGKDKAKPKFERETVAIENPGGATLGKFSNLMVKHTMVYAVTHGDDENGWIAVSEIKDEKLTTLRPSIPTAKRSSYPGPTCATVSPAGEYLVVSQMGDDKNAKDSRLVFYTLQGKMLRNFEVELNDIVALAYSPGRKHLFAIDYNFSDPTKGGLYKLIGKGADKCDIKKLQDVSYATSMVFDSKGTLWITTLGGPPSTDGKPNGKVIKIEGLDDSPESIEDAEDADEEDAEDAKESGK